MIRFLFKGLIRDRSRILFPFLTVAIGVFLTVGLYCYIKGAEYQIVEFNADLLTGHVKVMTKGYAAESDQAPNDLALTGVGKLVKELKTTFPGMTWAPRIRFGGLLDVPDEAGETKAQGTVAGTAADILTAGSAEIQRLGLENTVVRGRLPAKSGEILIGEILADRLNLEPGGKATFIGSTMNGGMATANFTISGVVRFGVRALDRMGLVMDIADAQAVLDMEDAAGEIPGWRTDGPYERDVIEGIASRFNISASASTDEFTPVMKTLRDQSDLAALLDQLGAVNGAVIAIFILAMSLVLWNSGLIGSLRRYGEIGVRLAMGEPKGGVYRAMLGEAVMIGFLGTIAGTAVALALSYYLQAHGINITGFLKNAAVMLPSVLRSRVTPAAYFIGFIPGILSTLIGTAIAGRGIYKRSTASLFKELET
ncbi:MAG: FtsX-like permease family protein [Candidatus Aminicenantes bacterium]|nr:FtsX-like permease family protein [Candidatus Aminicenantes bacterium]